MISLVAATLLLLAASGAPPDAPLAFAFTHVTVIDVTDGSLHADLTVTIRGERIESVTPSGAVAEGVRAIDARGKFLIPGLWDMHVHWYSEEYLPLFLANGVTGVRQMFGSPIYREWRTRFDEGTLAGPRMVLASRIVDGPRPIWPGSIAVGDAAEGRRAVGTAIEEGADFVKVYSLLPREAYFAIAEEARKRKIPFAGHVPVSVSAAEASDAGQHGIEHLTGVLLSSSSDEAELRRAWRDAPGWLDQTDRLVRTYDDEKAQALFTRFVANDTWHCPTLTVLRNVATIPDPAIVDDPNLAYMPPAVRAMWAPNRGMRWMNRAGYEKSIEIVGQMHRVGVRMLAGTDVLNPYCFPGFSLHGELELLVQAGLSPLAALQAATINPAEYLGMDDRLGTITSGKIADLVLLDQNPIEEIGSTRRIAAVVVNGRLFDRAALDGMLDDVKRQAK